MPIAERSSNQSLHFALRQPPPFRAGESSLPSIPAQVHQIKMLSLLAQGTRVLCPSPVVVFNQHQIARPNPKPLADFACDQLDSIGDACPHAQAVSEIRDNRHEPAATRVHSEPTTADELVVILILQHATLRYGSKSPCMRSGLY